MSCSFNSSLAFRNLIEIDSAAQLYSYAPPKCYVTDFLIFFFNENFRFHIDLQIHRSKSCLFFFFFCSWIQGATATSWLNFRFLAYTLTSIIMSYHQLEGVDIKANPTNLVVLRWMKISFHLSVWRIDIRRQTQLLLYTGRNFNLDTMILSCQSSWSLWL